MSVTVDYKNRLKVYEGEVAKCTVVLPDNRPEEILRVMKLMRSVVSPLAEGLVEIRASLMDNEEIAVEAVGFLRDRNAFGFLRGRNVIREVLIEKTLIRYFPGC